MSARDGRTRALALAAARPAAGRLAAALALAFALLSAAGCGGDPGPAPATPESSMALPPARQIPPFSYETLDGRELSPASLAGRISVIGFITTYDTASQAQARILAELIREHTPRINAATLVLEPAENRPLIEAFAAALRLPYPVAIADAATIAGQGPFAGLHHVPSVIILDRQGREVHRRIGLVPKATLDEIVRQIEKGPAGPGP